MAKLVWDKTGERLFETGTSNGVLYVYDSVGKRYGAGVAWNGLTAVSEAPEGADATDLYADNIKYATMRSAEKFKCTIEAYTYPDEFAECDGSAAIAPGVYIGQQGRKMFGFVYKTLVGSDEDPSAQNNYKLHIVYGCTAAPSQKSYATVNDSPEAITFSWEVEATPVNVTGFKPTANIVIDSAKISGEKLALLEDALFGSADGEATLKTPDEILAIIA